MSDTGLYRPTDCTRPEFAKSQAACARRNAELSAEQSRKTRKEVLIALPGVLMFSSMLVWHIRKIRGLGRAAALVETPDAVAKVFGTSTWYPRGRGYTSRNALYAGIALTPRTHGKPCHIWVPRKEEHRLIEAFAKLTGADFSYFDEQKAS